MTYTYPSYFWLLLLLAIPLVIHLVSFRQQKKLIFSNISFLKEIKSQQKRKKNLIQKLLLFSRILLWTFLILAFIKPFLGNKNHSNQKEAIGIYLDSSPSMSVEQGGVSGFSRAKQVVLDIIEQGQVNDKYFIITNSPHPNQYKWLDKSEAIDYISGLETFGAFTPFSQIWKDLEVHFNNISDDEVEKKCYLISDFQNQNFNDTVGKIESKDIQITAISTTKIEKAPNLYFEDANILGTLKTGSSSKLFFSLKRTIKDENREGVLKVFCQNELKGTHRYFFSKGQDVFSDTIEFISNTTGWNKIILSIDDGDFPIDDSFFMAVESQPFQKVLIIQGKDASPFLPTMFKPENNFNISTIPESQTISNLNNFNLVILDGLYQISIAQQSELRRLISSGASCFIFPGEHIDFSNYISWLPEIASVNIASHLDTNRIRINHIQVNHDIWQDVFSSLPKEVTMPFVYKHFPAFIVSGMVESIMSFSNGSPFITAKKIQNRYVVFCTSPSSIQASDISKTQYLLPLLYRLSTISGMSKNLNFRNDEKFSIPLFSDNYSDEIVHLKKGDLNYIANVRKKQNGNQIELPLQLESTGFWEIFSSNNQEIDEKFAINFGKHESDMNYLTQAELKSYFSKFNYLTIDENISKSNYFGIKYPLWKVLLLLGLLLLFFESWLLYKKAK